MALEWFCLETWIKEDTLVGKKVTERGRTRTLTVLNIHLFHTFSLVLVLGSWDWSLSCVIGRASPWTDGQSITHIHTHYSLQFTCPICLWIVGERKPMSTWREHTNSTYKDSWRTWDSNTAHTAMHYTRLMIFFVLLLQNSFIFSSFYINVFNFTSKFCTCTFVYK